jgi:hypothetical protein
VFHGKCNVKPFFFLRKTDNLNESHVHLQIVNDGCLDIIAVVELRSLLFDIAGNKNKIKNNAVK